MGGNHRIKTRDAIKLIITEGPVARPGIRGGLTAASARRSTSSRRCFTPCRPSGAAPGPYGRGHLCEILRGTGFSNPAIHPAQQVADVVFNYKRDVNDFEGYEIDWAF